MRRTCERPGCAEPASVAFGMVPEDLVVWLEACDPATLGDDRPGLLCRRHADKMVVPVGWTLDDHREPVPRLFKVREAPPAPRPAGDHTGRTRRPKMQQASLLDLVAEQTIDAVTPTAPDPPGGADASGAARELVATDDAVDPQRTPEEGGDAPVPDADEPAAPAGSDPVWTPTFDRSDDLDGLLAPRGKLLRRAFGAEPPR